MQTLLDTGSSQLLFYPNFYPITPDLQEKLKSLELIQKPAIKIYGKICHQQRDVGFYSDQEFGYTYSGQTTRIFPLGQHPELVAIIETVNNELGTKSNGILINRYNTGKEYISAHSDDEKFLQRDGIVASIAYGAVRKFRVRDKKTKKIVLDIDHLPGSLLVMQGDFQKEFTHEIPPQLRITDCRYSLTFREHLKKD